MKHVKRVILIVIFICSTLAIGPVSAFSIAFEPGDGVQCSVNGCGSFTPITIKLDPCGSGGVTVTDPSGAPSCEPITQVKPEVVRYLRNAANKIEYELYGYKAIASRTSALSSATSFILIFEPLDGIPSPQCTETSCQIPIASEDPCGEGGITVLDPSGAPSCEPIAQIGPRLINILRYSANDLEDGLHKAYRKAYRNR